MVTLGQMRTNSTATPDTGEFRLSYSGQEKFWTEGDNGVYNLHLKDGFTQNTTPGSSGLLIKNPSHVFLWPGKNLTDKFGHF